MNFWWYSDKIQTRGFFVAELNILEYIWWFNSGF